MLVDISQLSNSMMGVWNNLESKATQGQYSSSVSHWVHTGFLGAHVRQLGFFHWMHYSAKLHSQLVICSDSFGIWSIFPVSESGKKDILDMIWIIWLLYIIEHASAHYLIAYLFHIFVNGVQTKHERDEQTHTHKLVWKIRKEQRSRITCWPVQRLQVWMVRQLLMGGFMKTDILGCVHLRCEHLWSDFWA